MVPALTWDDSYRPDRGKVLTRGAARRGQVVLIATPTRRRRHRLSHAAGRASEGRVLHPRVGPQPLRRLHRGRRRVRRGLDRIDRKIQRAARAVPAPIIAHVPGRQGRPADRRRLPRGLRRGARPVRRRGLAVDYMRVRGFPFGDEVTRFLESHEANFVVEQNRDAQLRNLLLLETGVPIDKMESVRYYAGFPMSAHHVVTGLKAQGGARGMTYIAETQGSSSGAPEERHRPDPARLRRVDHDALRRLRPRLDHRRDHPGVLASVDRAAPGRQAVGHRLLVEDAGLLPARGARLQRRARAHAGAGHRRERRQPRHHLHRHLRRRRLAVDRPRPSVPRHPPQRQCPVRAREQRRLRA